MTDTLNVTTMIGVPIATSASGILLTDTATAYETDKEGNVYVNDKLLEESHIKEKLRGETDIEYPYQVPDESYFVLGDDRSSSLDSRTNIIGTIKKENIIQTTQKRQFIAKYLVLYWVST